MVYKKIYGPQEVDRENVNEIWRYAGYKGIPTENEPELLSLLDDVKAETKDSFDYKVCFLRAPIEWEGNMPILPFSHHSENLAKCLLGSTEIIMFCATIGMSIDKLINRYEKRKPVKALILQAYGAERVEAVCDTFCRQIKDEVHIDGMYCTPRFSPGYGDLGIEIQKAFFEVLDCPRQIGVFINDSLLMTPSKSVTAIFGIGKEVKH